jgi:hypothetical protein
MIEVLAAPEQGRDADRWYASVMNTIYPDRAHAKRVFEEHNQAVIDAIPASRLLVYQPGDGWEPICRFLDVPVEVTP